MSETLNNTNEEAAETEAPTVEDETLGTEESETTEVINWEEKAQELTAQVEKWKSLSRKNERDLTKLKETVTIEGSVEEQLQKTQQELAEYKRTTLLTEIQKRFELPDEALKLLKGSTEIELEEEAELLASLTKAATQMPKKPVIKTQGSTSEPKEETDDAVELAKYLRSRRK